MFAFEFVLGKHLKLCSLSCLPMHSVLGLVLYFLWFRLTRMCTHSGVVWTNRIGKMDLLKTERREGLFRIVA